MATGYVRSELVTVFGGSGFVGRHVVRALARRGYRVRVAVRRPDLAGFLQPLGGVGQIHAVQANIRNRESIDRAIAGSDAVVNLVGILYESGRQSFDVVQAVGPGAVAAAARDAGVGRLVHISAIGADANSESNYARTKAAGEAAVRTAFPDAVIMRPSIVFGPEDDFFNRFGAMARIAPVLPLIGGGNTRFQPVYVGDVAEAVAQGVDGKLTSGTVYELGGPEIRTFKQLLEYILKVTGRRRILAPLPFEIAKLKAWFLQMFPKPLLTVDQVRLLARDNVVSEEAIKEGRTLEGIGIDPNAIETVVPAYLARYRKAGQFSSPDRTVSQS
ncbi:complex I NDUFA9 subunit family protein [Microbaculum marinisediminis]|uniref:Complex I NDUFA9 subunit family protein n=1 Tax=Microbaculum marinisediminis TaxID=2931392 RepID=A0AAW5QT68_9HYPH|nr:complex I NDUFA9 subunit family protein [Microbaculum sp. A6E488]MCT8970863.1 complex I NDUFA9 subunit family protein [Microbaculum sp. A6E488]